MSPKPKVKPTAAPTPFDDDFPMATNRQAPAAKKREMSRRAARRWLIAIGVGVVGIAVVAGGSLLLQQREEPAPVLSTDLVDSDGKALAMASITTWLGQNPAPVPGGVLLSWDGVDTTPAPTAAPGMSDRDVSALPGYAVELHHFTIRDGQGYLYEASVQVESNELLGSRVADHPSLLRIAPDAPTGQAWGQKVVWSGWETASAPAPVEEAVQAWAAAFTSGDPKALRLVVGDPDTTHSYMPVGIALGASVEVAESALPIPADGEDAPADTMLVRVNLNALLGAQPAPTAGETKKTSLMTYDLLVTGADTGSPRVVSWGGAGTGTSLEPYSVAVTGRDVGPAQDATISGETPAPTAAPEETPAPDASPAPAPTP
ncbi:hypothetical protein [Pseudoclavibacter sp. VKM Ac-2867]|uniref:hypothetical protein n=1 Tax=Pseudoclavibacter sp. VKM Ac-2867 TaxID=2783829 RepID=UPI00188DBB0F|nr:hypothetical protein [Pseudoclavibacter sp. VKM Ac-2867]MBF4459542.1 hypothetical protein [Pseudoclavibacter sp. VKM Ac-2867]